MSPEAAIARLEEVAGRDVGRGIVPLVEATRGELHAAAASIAGHEAPRVVIITGFYIAGAEPPAAETDGPPGAVQLAAALASAGVPVSLLTDEPSAPPLEATVRATGRDIPWTALPVAVTDAELDAVVDAWTAASPPVSHVIAVERPGPGVDGVCRNMKGDDISAWTAPLGRLFRRGPVRIGIGDGGNELGMGKLPRELVAASVVHGELTACAVGCDHLLVAGVSNWGAWALAAALGVLRPEWRPAVLRSLDDDWNLRLLAASVEDGGAVDGMLRRPALSVDGLGWDEHAEVLRHLRAVLAE